MNRYGVNFVLILRILKKYANTLNFIYRISLTKADRMSVEEKYMTNRLSFICTIIIDDVKKIRAEVSLPDITGS